MWVILRRRRVRVVTAPDEAWFRENFLALSTERTLLATLAGRGGFDAVRNLAALDTQIDALLDEWNAAHRLPLCQASADALEG